MTNLRTNVDKCKYLFCFFWSPFEPEIIKPYSNRFNVQCQVYKKTEGVLLFNYNLILNCKHIYTCIQSVKELSIETWKYIEPVVVLNDKIQPNLFLKN